MQIRSQARSIALPHQVLKRNEGVSFSAVPAGTEFDTGDSVKVAFALPAGTSFYILERGVAGPWQVLQKGVTPASGVVETPVLELATERRLLMVAGGTLESEAPAAVGSAAVRELSIADPSRTVQVTLRVRPKNR
jgi:hypothetical protein